VFDVNYSPAFKWFIALLLPITIVWKLTAAPYASSYELKDKLVEFLVHHQFDVVVLEEQYDYMPVISASAGRCRMLIMKVSADGWQRDLVRARAQATGRAFFVFRGKVYPDQPIWLTAAAHLWSRGLQKLGLRSHIIPVIAVIAPELCGAERLPWDELHESGAL
jgi:hypothetical protein